MVAYCIQCGKFVSYAVLEDEVSVEKRGVVFTYPELSGQCRECGNEVYVSEINDINVRNRFLEYEKARK